ncbi:MAG: helix-turn-helix domain-containing protein [Patescibacteria group bacterium]
MILETLRKIGFSEKEAMVYMQLIRLGSQAVSVISEKTRINRKTTYDIIAGLTKKGLVSSIKKGSVTYFKALDPKELLNYLEREKKEQTKKIEKQQNEIEALLPALISLENPESTKPKVTFYEGEKGMRQAYEDTLTSSETILAYANVEDMHKGLPNFFPDYYHRRGVEKKIHIKAIFPDNKISIERHKKDKQENRESLLVPSREYDFSPEINVYDDKILYASWREKMAIIIKSKEIADFHKQMYKLCWQQAKLEHKKLFQAGPKK